MISVAGVSWTVDRLVISEERHARSYSNSFHRRGSRRKSITAVMRISSDRNLIKHSEREPVSAASSGSCREGMPCVRETQDSLDRCINFIEEDGAESDFFLLIVSSSFLQFGKRGGSKSVLRHFLRDERSSSSAEDPSTTGSSPRSNASILSSDSAAHLVSISCMCSSSRLSQSRSIKDAFSVGSSFWISF